MEALAEQLTSRDAALLTWVAVVLVMVVWSLGRGGEFGRAALGIVRAFLHPRILSMVALVVAWQLAVVYFAARIGLWDTGLLKDTIVVVLVGGVAAGFKAHAMTEGKQTWRAEVVSLVALVVVVQWVSNLETFPYLVELALVPLAILLGGMQAVASLSEDQRAARPFINGMVMLLGLGVVGWSIYRVVGSWGSTEWDTVGKSFALAFWLPAALIPAVYVLALVMQYGKTLTMMKIVRPVSFGARADLYRHHRLNLRRLTKFARTPGRARQYARAESRAERLAILRASSD